MTPSLQMNDMVDIDQQWQGVEEPAGFTPIPDGRYNAVIEVARGEYNNNNQRCLYWELVIVEGPQEGKRIFRRNMLESPSNIGWLKADLRKCGIDVDAAIFQPGHFIINRTSELIGLVMSVQLKTGKPNDAGQAFQNCNFLEIATASTGDVTNQTPTLPGTVRPPVAGHPAASTVPGRIPGTGNPPATPGIQNPWNKNK